MRDKSGNPFVKRSAIKDCSVQAGIVATLNKVIHTITLQQGQAPKKAIKKPTCFHKSVHSKRGFSFIQISLRYLSNVRRCRNKKSVLLHFQGFQKVFWLQQRVTLPRIFL